MSDPNPDMDALATMMQRHNLTRPDLVVVSFKPRSSLHQPCLMTVTGPWYNGVPVQNEMAVEPERMAMVVRQYVHTTQLKVTLREPMSRRSYHGTLNYVSPEEIHNPWLEIYMDWESAEQMFLRFQEACENVQAGSVQTE